MDSASIVIIGAGPAGLTAAYELTRDPRCQVTVLEADAVVGGIARTAEYKGYLFDIGGHRFFTKVPIVERMWREVLGPDLLTRPRLSRICYDGKLFSYPLELRDVLAGLGPAESLRCALSYAWAKVRPERPETDFEAWVSNRFGRRLFRIFFQSYTEKVWGIPTRTISAEWAAQRIRGLSVRAVVWHALQGARGVRGARQPRAVARSLVHEFLYPRRGPGQMWARTRDQVEARGGRVLLNRPATRIAWEPGGALGVEAGGEWFPATHVLSSMPIRDFVRALEPAPPAAVLRAADDFHYRDFLTVALIVRVRDLFPDTWLYVHEPGVRVGRIQNFNNWSPDMVPDPGTTCLGLEYFCFEGDDLWRMPDRDLVALGTREVERLGLVPPGGVADGVVVRMPKAYPVYDGTHRRGLAAVRGFLDQVPNLQLIGRNGMHQYNNQDHSMLTAILAARNVLGGRYDLWAVNVDQDYHESGTDAAGDALAAFRATQPLMPARLPARHLPGR